MFFIAQVVNVIMLIILQNIMIEMKNGTSISAGLLGILTMI